MSRWSVVCAVLMTAALTSCVTFELPRGANSARDELLPLSGASEAEIDDGAELTEESLASVDPMTRLRLRAAELRAERAAFELAEIQAEVRASLPPEPEPEPTPALTASAASDATAPATNLASADGLEVTTTAVAPRTARPATQQPPASQDPASPWTLQLTTVVGGEEPDPPASTGGLTLSTSVVEAEPAAPVVAAPVGLVATARKPGEPKPGQLVIACDLGNEPFALLDENSVPAGRDVEMVETLARAMGHDVLWYRLPFDELLGAVESGRVHAVCATMGVTPERARRVAFTRPYFETDILAVVRSGTGEPRTIEDLAGLRVSAGRGTTSQSALERRAPDAEAVLENKDGLAAELRLAAGEIDAAVMDGPDARDLVLASKGRLRLLAEPLAVESYAIALPLNDRKALVAWNKALQAFEKSGEMAELDERYGLIQRQ